MLCNATVTWNGKVYRLGEDGAYLTNTWYSVEYDGNYYVKAEDAGREEILSHLLPAVIAEFGPESWLLNSVTLVQDKETFEKFEFVSMDKKWTRYVKMYR